MRVDLFDFDLPEELIAVHPIEPRDASRLLHIRPHSERQLSDRVFQDLPELLQKGDLVIFNDAKVIPALIPAYRVRDEMVAKVQLNLNRPMPNGSWSAFAKPAKKIKPGDLLKFSLQDLSAKVVGKGEAGEIIIDFDRDGDAFFSALNEVGSMPLPPYIASKRDISEADTARYQTIYAKEPGAVAAPTAGLHFTDEILNVLHAKGVKTAYVTLHVGGGTFLPVKSQETQNHKMHSEFAVLSKATAQAINAAKAEGRRVIAAGTTALRVLESAALEAGKVAEFSGDTDIFITPGYDFKIVDALITNFHLPKSTLFMLVSAFCGRDLMLRAYHHAMDERYRFYSYGDASLLERI